MGCFNINGFYSNLPIIHNQDIVLFLCIKNNHYNNISPIAPPIFGKYNDYGTIEELENRNYYKEICSYFGAADLINIIKCIDDNCYSRSDVGELYGNISYEMLKDILNQSNYVKSENNFYKSYKEIGSFDYDIVLCIEHRIVYDNIINECGYINSLCLDRFDDDKIKHKIELKENISKLNKITDIGCDEAFILQLNIQNNEDMLMRYMSNPNEDDLQLFGSKLFKSIRDCSNFDSNASVICVSDEHIKNNTKEFIEYYKFLRVFAITCSGIFIQTETRGQYYNYEFHKKMYLDMIKLISNKE